MHALSYGEVEQLRARFESLNSYNRSIVPGSILELEHENYELAHARAFADDRTHHHDPLTCPRVQLTAYAISAKRYTLYNDLGEGEFTLRRASQHGLGPLMDPTKRPMDQDADEPDDADRELGPRWIRDLWTFIIRSDALHQEVELPAWTARPAFSRVSANKASALKPFERFNSERDYADQVKPGNFLIAPHVTAFDVPDGREAGQFHLVSEFHDDFAHWEDFRFFDRGEHVPKGQLPTEYYVTTAGETQNNLVHAQSLADMLEDYRTHEEAKSLGPDGEPCSRQTAGLLQRRPVRVRRIRQIGKEANELEDVAAGLVSDVDDVLSTYEESAVEYEPS